MCLMTQFVQFFCDRFRCFVFASAILVQIRRGLLRLVGEDANAASILGANFTAGFVAGSLAAAATCPLDVAKTRRQIQVGF